MSSISAASARSQMGGPCRLRKVRAARASRRHPSAEHGMAAWATQRACVWCRATSSPRWRSMRWRTASMRSDMTGSSAGPRRERGQGGRQLVGGHARAVAALGILAVPSRPQFGQRHAGEAGDAVFDLAAASATVDHHAYSARCNVALIRDIALRVALRDQNDLDLCGSVFWGSGHRWHLLSSIHNRIEHHKREHVNSWLVDRRKRASS